MNTHTDNAIRKLQTLIPIAASIYIPKIEYAIAALLAGVEREQVAEKRIAMLENRLKEIETCYVNLCILADPLIGNEEVALEGMRVSG